jgi:hypothetical protein
MVGKSFNEDYLLFKILRFIFIQLHGKYELFQKSITHKIIFMDKLVLEIFLSQL